ncbi:MAG: autotransporter-associated beta strand repeat-containing protein [Methylotenera sp.]|jgi:fibronectin-binding autotransporter adhesin|nr:autotransporter-associated beta strand repeat-containing protein [Methylotenera sp.]
MRPCPTFMRALPAALALIGLLPHSVGAAVHVWTGAGSSANWSDTANWTGGLPAAGGELLLDSAARPASFNDLSGLSLLGLTLGANAPAPTLSGNALRFQGAGAYLRMLSDGGAGIVNNALVLDSTLQLTGGPSTASQLFLRGAINGSGGMDVVGGTAVLSGNNSFSGATRVAAGAALGVAGNALAGTGSIQVARGGELQIVGSNVITSLNAPLALGGRLSSSAPEIVVNPLIGLQPGGLYTGPITVTDDAEILALGGTPGAPVRFIVNGGIDLAGQSLTLATDGGRNRLQVAAIGGTGSLTLRPRGGEITTGAVTGATTLAARGNAGSATVASLAGNGRVLVDFDSSFGQLTITGALDGQRDLDVRRGTLNLGTVTPLSFAGQITLRGEGTLSLGRESYLGSASPVLQFDGGGRLVLRDGFGLTRDISTTGGRGALVFGGATNTVSGNISGDGGISFIGGVINVTGSNSFAGGLAVFNDGSINAAGQPNTTTLRFVHDGNLGAAGQGIKLGGGLALPDGYDLSRPLTVVDTAANLSGSGNHVISSDISGDGRLNLGGAARYVLTGTNTHTGGVALAGQANGQAAVLVIDSDARLGAAGGVLNIGRTAANNALITLPGTLVAAGNLDIAATRSTSFRNMTVDTNAFDVVFNQPINGLGITKAGAGTWTLNTANTNTSGDNVVQVLQGTLALGANEALGTRNLVTVADGARLALSGHVLTMTSLDTAAGSTVDLGTGGTLRPLFGTLEGALTGQGSLVVGRAGFSPAAVTLNGANSFTGAIAVTQGSRLTIGHADALGNAGNLLTLDNGALEASNRLTAPVVISAATPLQIGAGGAGFVAGGQSIVIERALTGPLTLSIQGGSRPGDSGDKFDVRLANRANSFIGDLQLGDPQGFGTAVLGITADGSLGAAGNRLILGKSFFDGESTRSAQGGLRAWDSLTLAATRTVLLDGESGSTAGFIDTNGHTVVLAARIGELQSGLGLLKTGAGTLVVNGVQAYTGRTTVEAGTLGGQGELEAVRLLGAALAPGESAGLLSIRQDLSFSDDALLTLELGGLLRGSGYDALDVGGSVDLGEGTTLRLSFIGGFVAAAGQTFELIHTGGGLFGQFANAADGERLLTTDGLGSFAVHYADGQRLVLSDFQATAVPEPGNWLLMLAGVAALSWLQRRR